MTTLRRLLVADYPIRLLLLVLAVWGVTADVSAQVRVGYYDMTNGNGAGIPQQATPIAVAGFTPVPLDNVTAADLAGLHILFVENPSPNVYGGEYLASRPAIAAAVNAGMVLVIHDRTVNNPAMMARVGDILPGVTAPASIIASKGNAGTNNTIEISVSTGLVVNGPFGQITSANLDGGMQSNHGHVNILNPFFTTRSISGLLHTGSGSTIQSQSVTFSYSFGLGYVIYSTIPLDKFLKSTENVAPVPAFRDVYAPNVLTYAACGLRAFPATVTAASASGHYGGTTTLTATVKCGVLPASGMTVTFSLNGVVVGSAQTDALGTATLMNASLGSSPASAIAVGTYATGVLADFGGAQLFGASSATASLTVEKAPASISVDGGGTFVYDGIPHAATGTVSGVFSEPLGLPSFTYTDKDGVTTDVAPVNVGKYDVTASVPESDNYLGTTDGSSAKIKITPASLVVTAHDASKIYGAALPDLTATYQGFVGDENAGVLGGTLQLATDATPASPVHEYKIEPSGVTSNNYDIRFVDGILAVTPAALTVRAEDASKIYGAALPDFTAAYIGFVLGETAEVLNGTLHFTTDATAASAVGNYAITPAGLKSHNYTIGFVDGALMVTPAALTVRADNKTRVYGAALPALTASYEGFVLHDGPGVLAGTLTLSTNATAASDVAEYAITPSGLTSNNYTVTFATGRLAVTPAPLIVRADDKSKVYGAALPALTASYQGFVLHDGPGVLEGTLALTTNATAASGVAEYAITPSGLTSNNYTVTFGAGRLAVTAAPLIVRADGKSKVYGAALPILTASYEGFVLGQGPPVLQGTLNLSTDATAASVVAQYAIAPSGFTSTNYAIVFINGILKVTPAALTIRANDQERLIGLPNPTLIVTYEGFVASDTAGSLDVPPSVTTTAILLSPAGTYPIVVRAAADANYSIQHVNGVLTVSPEGRMHGDGFIGDESQTFSFRFDVRDRLLKGERGSIELTVDRKDSAKDDKKDKKDKKDDEDGRRDTKKPSSDRFASKTLTSVVFSDDPDFIPGRRKRNPEVDSVAFAGIGTWNGVSATFDAIASDRGEPGRGHDHVRIIVRVAGAIVAQVEGPLDGGNIQSNRLPGGIR